MNGFLQILERAYQGTLEELDGQALWLLAALNNTGLTQSLLLRGAAVAYAVKNQSVKNLHTGGITTGHPPHMDQHLWALIDEAVPVHAVLEDARGRGIDEANTPPVKNWTAQEDVASLYLKAERVLAWVPGSSGNSPQATAPDGGS